MFRDTTMALITDSGYLDDPAHCPHPGLWSLETPETAAHQSQEPYLPPGFLVALAGLVVVCVTLTLIVAMALILLVQNHPMATVVLALTSQVLVPTTMGIVAMERGEPWGSASMIEPGNFARYGSGTDQVWIR